LWVGGHVSNYVEMGTVRHYGILNATLILVKFVCCLTEQQASRFEVLLFYEPFGTHKDNYAREKWGHC